MSTESEMGSHRFEASFVQQGSPIPCQIRYVEFPLLMAVCGVGSFVCSLTALFKY
jgi:hypothetical protein